MEEKDYIKELFKDRFNDFEADVDPGLWDKIQSEITDVPQIPKSTSGTTIGKTIMWVAAASITTISAIAYTYWSDEDDSSIIEQKIEQLDSKIKVADKKSEEVQSWEETIIPRKKDITVKESIENKNQDKKESFENETLIEVNDRGTTLKENSQPASVPMDVEIEENTAGETLMTENQNVISKAPKSIDIHAQSRVVASPMGGNAPLEVAFGSVASVKNIKWQFDDGEESNELAPNHTYTEPGIYFVTMMAELEDGTMVMDKAVIEVKEEVEEIETIAESSIFVPNIFTPNGDSENDILSVEVENVESYTISIYCVNGRLVFNSDNPDEKWDGRDPQGNIVEEGVYYYLINAIGKNNNVYAPKGYITIRR